MIDLKGPSASEIKNFIKEKSVVEFITVINKSLKGQIIWADDSSYHIQLENGSIITLLRPAVIYYSKIK